MFPDEEWDPDRKGTAIMKIYNNDKLVAKGKLVPVLNSDEHEYGGHLLITEVFSEAMGGYDWLRKHSLIKLDNRIVSYPLAEEIDLEAQAELYESEEFKKYVEENEIDLNAAEPKDNVFWKLEIFLGDKLVAIGFEIISADFSEDGEFEDTGGFSVGVAEVLTH
jgi:hypothetical protein